MYVCKMNVAFYNVVCYVSNCSVMNRSILFGSPILIRAVVNKIKPTEDTMVSLLNQYVYKKTKTKTKVGCTFKLCFRRAII